jgi:hypothetical protein
MLGIRLNTLKNLRYLWKFDKIAGDGRFRMKLVGGKQGGYRHGRVARTQTLQTT